MGTPSTATSLVFCNLNAQIQKRNRHNGFMNKYMMDVHGNFYFGNIWFLTSLKKVLCSVIILERHPQSAASDRSSRLCAWSNKVLLKVLTAKQNHHARCFYIPTQWCLQAVDTQKGAGYQLNPTFKNKKQILVPKLTQKCNAVK